MKSRRGAGGSSAAAKEVAPPAPVALKKGSWSAAEDVILREYVKKHGEGNWNAVQKHHGLNRCGKSCRLRWTNHLRPNLKKGAFSREEELLVIHLHAEIGNKWARMATYLPGRTDNEIKNCWNTRLKKQMQPGGLPPYTPEMHREFLLSHGYDLSPSANSSSASPVPAIPPPPPPPPLPLPPTLPPAPASALPSPLRPPPLSLQEPITLPSSPSPATAAAFSPSLPLLAQNQFSSGFSFQSLLSSPQSPDSLALAQQLSVSCPASPSPQSPLLQPQLQQPLPYNLGSFDLNPPPCFTQVPFTSELPSSQMLGGMGGCGSSDGFDMLRSSDCTGLLDDVVREARRLRVNLPSEQVPAAGGQDGNCHGNLGANDDVSKGSTFLPAQGSVLGSFSMPDGSDYSINGIEMRSEATNKISPAHGDIATLSTVPAIPVVPTMPATTVDRHNNDSREISNGRSSVVTDDDMGLNMHQLTSSYAVAHNEQEWVINPNTWNDMLGTC